ncbi:MAG: hypothetical protein HYV24_13290 [Deltaproteobacteria bacterium]|nr:hypothetical protein [Deltaproteobacteria bacterium]
MSTTEAIVTMIARFAIISKMPVVVMIPFLSSIFVLILTPPIIEIED